ASAGFDDAAPLQPVEQRTNAFALPGAIGIKRIERVMIEGDGDREIAEIGQDLQGFFEPMMGESVRIVTQQHHGTASMNATSGTCLRSSSSMPLTTSMMELGQFPHTPPSRMRATPSVTSSTSSSVPSISSAGPTCCASAAATRDFSSSAGTLS